MNRLEQTKIDTQFWADVVGYLKDGLTTEEAEAPENFDFRDLPF